jgi:hypothetical protein
MPSVFEAYYGVQTVRTNLVLNPSFETNTTSWNAAGATGAISRSSTYARFGTYSCQRTVTSTAAAYVSYNVVGNIPVTVGSTYSASAYNISSAARTTKIFIQWRSATNTLVSTSTGSTSAASTSTWTRYSVTGTAPAGAASAVIYLSTDNAVTGDTVYWDGVLFEQSSSVGGYFDGSLYTDDGTFASYGPLSVAWTGTAHGSTSTFTAYVWTLLANVQEMTATIGRRLTEDVFTPSSAQITVRYPTGFASPLSQISIGSYWQLRRVGTTLPLWNGRLRDASVKYGIPYSGGVGNADYLYIDLEGAMADWGRMQGNNYAMAAGDVSTQSTTAISQVGLPLGSTYTTYPSLGSITISGSWLEYWNTVARTLGTTLKDGSGQLGLYTKDTYGVLGTVFSDTTNDSSNQVYDQIEFRSMSADYWTRIQVETVSYGNVVASSGSAPYRTLPLGTNAASASQATDIANYWLGIYSQPAVTIYSISCVSEAQNTWNLGFNPYAWWDIIGYKTAVTFRGTTKYFTIIGSTFTATPDGSRFTYYLAPADMTPYLVLDSSSFGILDTNKLSW